MLVRSSTPKCLLAVLVGGIAMVLVLGSGTSLAQARGSCVCGTASHCKSLGYLACPVPSEGANGHGPGDIWPCLEGATFIHHFLDSHLVL